LRPAILARASSKMWRACAGASCSAEAVDADLRQMDAGRSVDAERHVELLGGAGESTFAFAV